MLKYRKKRKGDIPVAKKKKNSNYVTEKTINAKAEKERAKKAARRNKLLRAILIPSVAVLLAVGIIIGIGFPLGWWNYTPVATHHATIEIEDYGTLHVELYGNDAPETVENFVKLAEEGYYDELTFHRIIEDFMAQGGEGMGTPSITGEFRANGFRNRIKHTRGVISMARSDDMDSASDEFFIVQKDSPHLNGYYAAFGKVTSGMEVIDAMCADAEPYNDNGSIAPYAQPRIMSITIHEVHDH